MHGAVLFFEVSEVIRRGRDGEAFLEPEHGSEEGGAEENTEEGYLLPLLVVGTLLGMSLLLPEEEVDEALLLSGTWLLLSAVGPGSPVVDASAALTQHLATCKKSGLRCWWSAKACNAPA